MKLWAAGAAGAALLAACSSAPKPTAVAASAPAPKSKAELPYLWTLGNAPQAYKDMVAEFGKAGLKPGQYYWASTIPAGETKVIIDHLGRPFQGTPEEHAVVIGWSKYPNTIMKLSSIPASTTYPHRDIRPVIRQLTEAWGAERMIYGGGFGATATGASYAQAFKSAASYLSHLSADDQSKIFGGNAVKLFQFGT